MKVSLALGIAAALSLLAAAPDADAFMIQGSSSAAAINGPRVADPDDMQRNLTQSWTGGETTPLGTYGIGSSTLHFGMSQYGAGAFRDNGSNWFLESPAARTVPSQR